MSERSQYHHGGLRDAILTEAATLVAERGVGAVSVRELARRAGVSHNAYGHHFTDRRGLFTALAAQGFMLLAEALREARGNFLDGARAYVRFAIGHPGHYAVMFDWSLIDRTDSDLAAAHAAASMELARSASLLQDPKAVADRHGAELAAWSLIHGFSMLWLNGVLPSDPGECTDPIATAERVALMLFET
ncbi:TetR/AcrR family transcriptional regulator [Mycobacterium ulcerans]|uniref:Transcriptional regulatory protein n=3 Tax=Mycobacterium ulcerans TaxID=1809 RepID=A0PRJ8_MYCUA|nr:TetR/AcrR family transcriptional regulator [Mycobacterium ulcerans]EUA89323.1 bacterial regulatory s, tetR family protein [Mycobacterium ulcerans str. Harvey]ABL04967.1 transcriptional regulatory protein [Mycobacterium ulcerans Agy99]MEB3904024.1 TetR/AcrR family transcriptional regulator [Mycobacterium ulcerans]MEB3908194.1 TetR/AcrR family transcriptional regulator [Mycobacterium ulcerans]MEB3918463.1 TetR/AcrR family transcriptional regulator [Mycobacterium ulcerans]